MKTLWLRRDLEKIMPVGIRILLGKILIPGIYNLQKKDQKKSSEVTTLKGKDLIGEGSAERKIFREINSTQEKGGFINYYEKIMKRQETIRKTFVNDGSKGR